MLEMMAKPVKSLQDTTPLLRRLLECNGGLVANFHGGNMRTMISIQDAWNLTSQSRRKPGRWGDATTTTSTSHVLCLKTDHDAGHWENQKRTKLSAWVENQKGNVIGLWESIQSATSVEASI
jgi:hypothetical protein